MQVQIRFSGDGTKLTGTQRLIEISNPATVADAVQKLTADPKLAGVLSRCTYSMDGTVVGASYPLLEGSELSVLLPECDD